LTLHPGKTRLIEFGRFAAIDRQGRGLGRPETFNFLGSRISAGVPGPDASSCAGAREATVCGPSCKRSEMFSGETGTHRWTSRAPGCGGWWAATSPITPCPPTALR
jgi:hypothetical protein